MKTTAVGVRALAHVYVHARTFRVGQGLEAELSV